MGNRVLVSGNRSPVRMVNPFAAVLQQATDIFDASLVGIVCPRARTAVSAGIRQVEGRNHTLLIGEVADHMVTAEVVAVGGDKVVCC